MPTESGVARLFIDCLASPCIVVGGSGINLVRLTADEGDDEGEPDNIIDKARINEAIAIVSAKPSMELADTYGLRERRIVQMAAGASLIEATLDCYSLETMEASDSSLREGAIIAWAQAGSSWRDQISALVSGT